MRPLKKFAILLAAVLSLTAVTAFGDSYDFSYLFASGDIVSGSLIGTTNGNFIENVSNVTIAINGNQEIGPVVLQSTEIFSFSAQQSNIIITGPTFFLLSAFTGVGGVAQAFNGSVHTADIPFLPANWSLTDRSASVPDDSATAIMLGIALAGVAYFRRKGH